MPAGATLGRNPIIVIAHNPQHLVRLHSQAATVIIQGASLMRAMSIALVVEEMALNMSEGQFVSLAWISMALIETATVSPANKLPS